MEYLKNIFKRLYLRYLTPNKYAKYAGVDFGNNCNFRTKNFGSEPYLIKMGNNVRTASNVFFLTHAGGLSVLRYLYPEYKSIDLFEQIIIGNNVFIGRGVTIMPGVNVGDNVIIGANSTVTRGVLKSNSIYAGIPAKYICSIDEFKNKHKNKFINTYNLPPEQKKQYIKEKFNITNK